MGQTGAAVPLVWREHLLVRAHGARLVLLAAPGGYGKTTLANQIADRLGHGTGSRPAHRWRRRSSARAGDRGRRPARSLMFATPVPAA